MTRKLRQKAAEGEARVTKTKTAAGRRTLKGASNLAAFIPGELSAKQQAAMMEVANRTAPPAGRATRETKRTEDRETARLLAANPHLDWHTVNGLYPRNSIVMKLTSEDRRRFEETAKRAMMTPEELLRVMAFQACREMEQAGRITLTHTTAKGPDHDTLAKRVVCVVELYPHEAERLQELSARLNRPPDYIPTAYALSGLNSEVLMR